MVFILRVKGSFFYRDKKVEKFIELKLHIPITLLSSFITFIYLPREQYFLGDQLCEHFGTIYFVR